MANDDFARPDVRMDTQSGEHQETDTSVGLEIAPLSEAPRDGSFVHLLMAHSDENGGYSVHMLRWGTIYSIHGLGGNWTDGLCNMSDLDYVGFIRPKSVGEAPALCRGHTYWKDAAREIPGVKSAHGEPLPASDADLIRRMGAAPIRLEDLTNPFDVGAADRLLKRGLARFGHFHRKQIVLTEYGRAAFVALTAMDGAKIEHDAVDDGAKHGVYTVAEIREEQKLTADDAHLIDCLGVTNIAIGELGRHSNAPTVGRLFERGLITAVDGVAMLTDAGRAKLVEAGWQV